jgi:hypothetical protein
MSGTLRHLSQFILVGLLTALIAGCPIDPGIDAENPAGVALERSVGAFTPGEVLTVSVTITAEDSSAISALGLTETVPVGWTYVSVDGEIGQVPAIPPNEGDTGDLGFIWFAVPDFPVTFTYTLQVPANAEATADIAGRVDYYEDAGILSSDEVVSLLDAAGV